MDRVFGSPSRGLKAFGGYGPHSKPDRENRVREEVLLCCIERQDVHAYVVQIFPPWPVSSYQCEVTERGAKKRYTAAYQPVVFLSYRLRR